MNNSVLFGITVTFVMHVGLAGGVAAFSYLGGDDGPNEPEMKFLAIEASLAYKSETQTNQPQKPKTRARKPSKPSKAPTPTPGVKPPDKPPPPDDSAESNDEDYADDVEKYLRERQGQADEEDDPDADESAQDSAPSGQFDGSKHGFAEVNKGDPYMRELAGEVRQAWSVVSLEQGTGAAEGCIRLAADGSVMDSKLWKATGNANLDLAASNALEALKKQRTPGSKPVPRHLMDATTQWICFKFTI